MDRICERSKCCCPANNYADILSPTGAKGTTCCTSLKSRSCTREFRIDQITASGSTLPESKTGALSVALTETPMSVAECTTLKLSSDADQKS